MPSATRLSGRDLAASVVEDVEAALETLAARGVQPHLGTLLASDDDAARAYMDRKHDRCADVGIATTRREFSGDVDPAEFYGALSALARDDDVTAIFVQAPLPDQVDAHEARARMPPAKDVDCFAPANLGELVAGDPRVVPPTPAAVVELLDAYGVGTPGRDVVIVGRTVEICRPLASLFLRRGPAGDATVTVCHSRTTDLGAKTRQADILVTAAGTPGLISAEMVAPGATVVDISANRVESEDGGHEVVGDVDFESVAEEVSAITPVPGGVGPLTLAFVLRNVVIVTARQAGLEDVVTVP